MDLDGLYKLLLFERMELGVTAEGNWSVYYRHPCRFLNQETFLCSIHNTALQPKTCVFYKPYGCWYQRVLVGNISDTYARVDLPRFQKILPHFKFDHNRRIVAAPPFQLIKAICQETLEQEVKVGLPEKQSAGVSLRDFALETPPPPEGVKAGFLDLLQDPCDSCPAPCCRYLCFRISPAASFMSLDFYRFTLGFPGVELGIGQNDWWVIIQSQCHHLDPETNRCQVIGKPERPLACSYYNQWACTHKSDFLHPLPPGLVRIRYEHLPALAALMEFDPSGKVTRLPEVRELQQALVQTWRDQQSQTQSGDDCASTQEGESSNGDGAQELSPQGSPPKPTVFVLGPISGSEASIIAKGE